MKSRTSFCNKTIVKKGLLRGAPLWGAYTLVMLLAMPLSLLDSYYAEIPLNALSYIQNAAVITSSWLAFAYGPIVALLLFSWLYRSRSANFFGALPLTRTNLFCSNYLTGLLYAAIPYGVTALFSIFVVLPASAALVVDVLLWLLYSLMGFVFYYSFAVLCAMVVGHLVAMPLLYVVLNFTVVVVEFIVSELLNAFVYGVDFSTWSMIHVLSPLVFQSEHGLSSDAVWEAVPDDFGGVTEKIVGYELHGQGFMWVLLAAGLVCILLAFFLHRKRRLEAAGDVIAINRLKPVFLYGFTLGCSLVIGWVLAAILVSGSVTYNFVPVLLCMLTGAVLGYFAGEMMLQKSLRVFRKKNWLRCGISCAAIIAIMLCFPLDLFGIAGFVPEVDRVQSVRLGYTDVEVEDPQFIEQVIHLHQDLVDRRVETERLNQYANRTPTVRITYTLKSGRVINRRYKVPVNENTATDPGSLIRQYEAIYNAPDYIVTRELPEDISLNNLARGYIYLHRENREVYLTPQELYDLLHTAFLPDMREGKIGGSWYTDDYQPTVHPSATEPTVTVIERADLDLQIEFKNGSTRYFTIQEDCIRTIQAMIHMGFVPESYFQSNP